MPGNGVSARAGGAPIGLFGGSFDPVHNGHLRAALEAYEALALDHVRLLPLNQPGHRAADQAPAAERLALLEAVARPPLVLDRQEVERGGTTYTVDTLEAMRTRFPLNPLCLLLGLDSYLTLPAWHRANELLGLCHLVVVARPAADETALPGLDELTANAQSERVGDLHDSLAGRVYFLDIPLLPIASSDLRTRLRAGRSIRYLVPEPVDDLIRERGLYRA